MDLRRTLALCGWVLAFVLVAPSGGQVPANDLCDNAELISLATGCPLCVPLTGGRLVVYGATRNATVDGSAPGCGGNGNTAKGVWFRLVGRGNRVLLSTDVLVQGTQFDTQLAVYCGSCAGLGCVAFNDDKTNNIFQSELAFCARDGVTYWILVNGFSGAVGDFGLAFWELPGAGGQPIACCDPLACAPPEAFVIPAGAVQESGCCFPGPEGPMSRIEQCSFPGPVPPEDDHVNDGCTLTPPPGSDRLYGLLTPGQTVWGHVWSHNQSRDRDWFVMENLPNENILVRYEFSSEGPLRPRWYYNSAIMDFFDCAPALGFVNASLPGHTTIDAVVAMDTTATSRTGQMPGGTVGFLVFHLSNGDGYPCGVNTRYWFTIHEVIPVSNCTAIPPPAGAQFEDTVSTYNGLGGDDGFTAGEPCYTTDPDGTGPDSLGRKGGCGASPISDGDFLRLTPGVPMVGSVYGVTGAQGASRDIDWYKFDLPQRSAVDLRVESAGLFEALISENNCDNDAVTYAIAGTRGTCLVGTGDAPDLVVLDPGTYILIVYSGDPFPRVGSWANFSTACTDPTSTYVVTLNADPLPVCVALCPPGALVEAEACVLTTDEMFEACGAALDNDGCSRAPYSAQPFAPGVPACGTLFSVYEPPTGADPELGARFFVDQDYWSFSLPMRSTVTFSAAADGPVRVQFLHVGIGGALCSGGGAPIIAEVDAGACLAGDEVSIEVGPGMYVLAAAPGSVEIGLSFGDYPCGEHLNYSLVMSSVPACCLGNADRIVPGAVGFGDITSVLANFGEADPSGLGAGDADCDGQVTFADVTAVLVNFLASCP